MTVEDQRLGAVADLVHVVITRFNVRLDPYTPAPSDAWLRRRLDLFERTLLLCMLGQRTRPHRWMIICTSESPSWFIDHVREILPDWAELVFLDGPFDPKQLASEVLRRAGGSKPLLTTRIDNDDCISEDFVELLQRHVRPDDEFINFTRGLQYQDGRLYARPHLSNAFISRLEDAAGPQGFGSVFVDWHDRIARYGRVRQVRTHPVWLQIVHGGNVRNEVRAIRVRPNGKLDRFPISLPIARDGRARLWFDTCFTALRLAPLVMMRAVRITTRRANRLRPPGPRTRPAPLTAATAPTRGEELTTSG